MGGLHSTEKTSDAFDDELQTWLRSPEDRFFVNIRAPNLLQVVDAPKEILEQLLENLGALSKCVRPIWRSNCYEIELFGSPFLDSSTALDDANVSIDAVFCRFLSAALSQNWRPHVTVNLSPFCDRSTCYFQKHAHPTITGQSPVNVSSVSVTFPTPYTVDIASNEDACLDNISAIVQSAFATTLQILRVEHKACALASTSAGRRGLRAPYNLWKCVSVPDSVISRRFLLEIVARLENIGYRLSTSIDFRGNADTLFFAKSDSEIAARHEGKYCMLSANRWDLLRLYEAPKDLVDVTRLLLDQHWPRGIEAESAYQNWHEFQFSAFPWAARAADAVQSHSMMANILQTYLARGWKPVASVQMSRTFKDRSCVILRKEKPAYRPHMCLGLLDSNELHLINAEDDLRDYVLDSLGEGKVTKKNSKGGWPFLTLRGDPWCTVSLAHRQNDYENGHHETRANECDYLEARAFVQKLLVALRFRGWDAVVNVDLAARVKYKRRTSGSGGKNHNSGGKPANGGSGPAEDTMPLDVNSLILANVNGSRHNSFARSANEPLFAIRTREVSVE